MANCINVVVISGNVTRDPECRLAGKNFKASFRIASTRRVAGGEKTCFVEIEAWDGLAEIVQRYVVRGKPVVIQGELELQTWGENKRNSRIVIRADQVQLQGGHGRGQQAAHGAPREGPPHGQGGAPGHGGGAPGGDPQPPRGAKTPPVEPEDDDIPF